MPFDQRQIIEQAKFSYSPLGKDFAKEAKTIKEQGKKKIDVITKQNEKLDASVNTSKRLEALTNKDDHKDNYKKLFEESVIERSNDIKERTDEINHDDLIYYFKGDFTGIYIYIYIYILYIAVYIILLLEKDLMTSKMV